MLSSGQVAEYQCTGFAVQRGLIDKSTVDELLREIEEITIGSTASNHDATRMEMEGNQKPDGALVRRIYDPCTKYRPFIELSESGVVLDCVEQLIGADLVFQQSKVNMKPPKVGSVVEWHQDMAYGPLTNRNSLALLLYLDDADITNGCLQVLSGQHLNGLLDHTVEGEFQGRVTEELDVERAVAIEGEAGTVTFLHCMTPHSSLPNRSDRPRRTLIWGYRAPHAYPVQLGNEGLVGVDRLVRGRKLGYARFEEMRLPVPVYPESGSSLYELQERSREGQ